MMMPTRYMSTTGGILMPTVATSTSAQVYTGRLSTTSAVESVNSTNVIEVVNKALMNHTYNASAIEYLYNYHKGRQPILDRVKLIRPEITNRVVENHAQEMVSFYTGYFVGDPILYTRYGDYVTSEDIDKLSIWMRKANKSKLDLELAEWLFICGLAYRCVLPKAGNAKKPFIMDVLDPRNTFVIRSTGPGREPLASVQKVITSDDKVHYVVYTPVMYFDIVDGKIAVQYENGLGMIPIIEYQANAVKMGTFELVLPLLDAINATTSNRIDGVEQFIQNLLVIYNGDIDSNKLEEIRAYGLIKIKSPEGVKADVKFIEQALNQADTQVLLDAMLQTAKEIVGMPNRAKGMTGGASGNVGSVVMWQGWEVCEARTKMLEGFFAASERDTLDVLLTILDTKGLLKLDSAYVEIKFTRRQYDASITKAQIFQILLQSGVDKETAAAVCGLFSDAAGVAAKMTEVIADAGTSDPASGGSADSNLPGNQ